MVLTLQEKEKLYDKALALYEKIKEIKIRETIEVSVPAKYYPSNSRYSSFGFKYYLNGSITMFGEDIKDSLEELKNYLAFKNGTGEEYVNNKSVSFISAYSINALLDFIYYGDKILNTINEKNEQGRKELNDLLS